MEIFLALNKGIHILAAVVGAGAATLEEILYFKDIRDGKIDENEAKQLRLTYKLMHWSVIALLISGVLMVGIIASRYSTAIIFESRMSAKYLIFGILIANAFLIKFRKIPLWFASPISLISWWAEFVLGKWRTLEADLYVIMAAYILAVLIAGLGLNFIKKWIQPRKI